MQLITTARRAIAGLAAVAALAAAPLAAQSIETFDPDTAIDADLVEQPGAQPVYTQEVEAQPAETQDTAPQHTYAQDNSVTYTATPPPGAPTAPALSDPATATTATTTSPVSVAASQAASDPAAAQSNTYKEDDLIGAAQGLFGEGAEGIARLIQDLLAEQGEPNAYIVGREASGEFIIGARYGSGTLYHKVEGQRPVYWTGPSIGFDVGANAGNTFVLVYNLYDTEQLYERYPAGEGQLYVVGGLTASYLRKGNVVLIPIRLGAGLRLGINAGYMKFSKEQKWLPF